MATHGGDAGGGGAVYMIVSTAAAGDRNPRYILADVAVVELMGVRCFRGRLAVIDPRHFMADRTAYFPVDKVLLIVEYESMAAYREAADRHTAAGIGATKAGGGDQGAGNP